MSRRIAVIACLLAAIGCASSRPDTFCARLAGAGPESDARDPNAKGSAVFQFTDPTTLRFAIRTIGVGTVVATHIHRGAAGTNGSMVREINPGFTGDSFEGTATGLPPELASEIREKPGQFYLKLHSLRYPGGAIRGQLVRCREKLIARSVP